MLYSKLFIPTLRDDHPLLIRAGYMRKHDYLFLGRRVLRKIVSLIRDELDSAGGQEFLAESHASLAVHAREIRGAKQLPQIWYQFNGFTLEAIAFGASPFTEISRRILAQCECADGVENSDQGTAESPLGTADFSPRGASAPHLEPVSHPPRDLNPEPFHTPNQKTIADLTAFTGVPPTAQMKSVVMMADDKIILALVRGDHQLDESKLKLALLATELRPANATEIHQAFGADAGSLGPVGLTNITILCDDALQNRRNLICGANRNGYHLRNVTPGKDFEGRFF